METAAQYNRNGIIETTGSRRAIASPRPNSSTHRMSRFKMCVGNIQISNFVHAIVGKNRRRTLPQIFVPMLPDMSFRHATVARLELHSPGGCFGPTLVLTPFLRASGCGVQRRQ